MYSYDDLFLFTKIVEVGSFIGTARLLKIGQSTVSRRMKNLEEQLNLSLFRQHNKGYELTEAGRSLYKDILEQKDIVDNLVSKHIQYRKSPQGTLRVALPIVLSIDLIAPYLPDFLEQYPGVNLETCYHNTEIDLVRDGFDIAIINHIPAQQTQKIKHVFTSEYYLYCTKEYQQKYGIPRTPEELEQHIVTGIMREDYTVPDKIEVIHRHSGKSVIIKTPRRIALNNVLISLQMVHSHKVIGGALDSLSINTTKNLIRVLPEYIIGTVRYYLLRHPYEKSILATAFCRFIEELLANR
mgnify:CR=1 FL=1